ncbi:M48 family metallopeptidase [Apibacter raozihei]|uniref:M48 family metallopeptidase n=1 Tax=Apibacter raozihei TaxID=2500547 RepID=UPI000FE3CF4C|nr:M48 family metallopeptidase [Apibacter raozihei]
MKANKLIAASAVALLTVACATNPLTGRKSLNFVSNSQILPLSFQQYTQVLSSSKLITGTAQSRQVSEVGSRIKNAAEAYYKSIGQEAALNGYEWQFVLIDDPKTINAWCMPGGKVAVYSGILPVTKTDAGLAVVLGHEIAHALAGHGAEKISQSYVSQVGGQLLSGVTSNQQLKGVINDYYPIASNITLLRYGRKQETDADAMGLYIMSMAGYDPREAPLFWERMIKATEASGGNNTPEFLSTHPNPENRIADLNKDMSKALEYYNSSPYKNSSVKSYSETKNTSTSKSSNATNNKGSNKTNQKQNKAYMYK